MKWRYVGMDDIFFELSKEIIGTVTKLKLCPCGGKLKEVNKSRYWFSGNATGIVYECEICSQWWLVDEEIING